MKDFLKYMLACFCALFLVNVLLTVVFVITLIGAAFSGSGAQKVSPNSVYQIDLKGVLEERASEDPMASVQSAMMGKESESVLGLNDLLDNIRKAKDNDNIKGIYLHGGELSGGLASMREVRNALLDFKSAGKFIYAYADQYGQANYYLASVADSLFINPYGELAWHGMSYVSSFYKTLADNLGVDVQIFRVGTYKSAVEPFMLTGMSEANKEQTKVMIDGLWSLICRETAEARGIAVDSLNAYADLDMDFAAPEEYLRRGFADKLIYEQDMDSVLAHAVGDKDFKVLTHSKMCNVEAKKKTSDNKIAVFYAYGDIVDSGTSGIVGEDVVEELRKVADDKDIKAVVLRVNSPGGSAFASEQIWYAITQLKHQKPLVVSMGDYAASGGYYISCAADSIFAQPSTLTGSIGIFGLIPNFKRLMDRIGITHDGVKTHQFSDLQERLAVGTPDDAVREQVQQSVNRGYDQFTRRCADGRGLTQDSIFAIASGRVWTGEDALRIGLVDKLGYLDDAIKSAAALAGIEEYEVKECPAEKTWQEKLMKQLDLESVMMRRMEGRLSPQYRQMIDVLTHTERYSGVQARMEGVVNF